ncbi:hypothetical protein ES702_00181 [subsurface metagenome]
MNESAGSDTFEATASVPESSPSHTCTMENAEVSRRTGVESREEVLRQVREHEWEIIELDPDPTPTSNHAHESPSFQPGHYIQQTQATHTLPFIQKRTRDPELDNYTQPTKQRKLSDGIGTFTSSILAAELQSGLGLTPTSSTNSSVIQNHASRHKRSLWCSDKAKENMLKISGLPSPESTSSSRSFESQPPLHKIDNEQNPFTSSSWSFDELDEPSGTPISDSTIRGAQTHAEPAVQGPRHLPPARSSGTSLNPLDQRKKDFEKNGIAESQRLRAQHQDQRKRPTLIKNPAPSNRSHPGSRIVAPQSGSGQGAARSDHKNCSPDRNEDGPAQLEKHLDGLMNHKRAQRGLPIIDVDSRESVRSNRNHSNIPHPYSREAAEKWRTQNRHLNGTRQAIEGSSPNSTSDCEVVDALANETRIAMVRAGAYQTKSAKRDREAEQRLLSKKFHAPDLEDRSKTKSVSKPLPRPKPPARSQAEVQTDLQKLMGTARPAVTPRGINSDEPEDNANEQNEKYGEAQQRNLPTPTLSALNQLGSGTKRLGVASGSEDLNLKEAIDNLPEQKDLTDLALPKRFEVYTESEKQVFIERETKKEREKDLDLIRTIFSLGAQLGSLNAFDTSDPKLLSQLTWLRKFTEAVLENNKAGKPIRHQIRTIRDAFKRRLDNIDQTPDAEAADRYLPLLLQPELFEKLSADIAELKDRLPFLQAESIRINSLYHKKSDLRRNRHRAKLPFTTKDSAGRLVGSNSSSQPKFPAKKLTLDQLRALHAQYPETPEDRVETIDLGPSRDDSDDSEISEEDGGEGFTRPAGSQKQPQPVVSNQEPSLEEVNRLENERQQSKAHTSKTQPSQGVDQQLLNRMRAKHQQQDHLNSQGAQKSDPQVAQDNRQRKFMSAAHLENRAVVLEGVAEPEDSGEEADHGIDQEPSQEFDDSDIDDPDDDEEIERVCRRYIVKGVCNGVSRALDEDQHLLGKYLNKDNAREKIHEFIDWTKQQVRRFHPELEIDTFKDSTSETKGSVERQIVFGDGEDIVCRAWFDEELYTPSEEAYQKAKVYRACRPTVNWVVQWKRTITPYEELEEDDESDDESMEESNTSNTVENEDSSGEDTSEPENSSVKQLSDPKGDQDAVMEHVSAEVSQFNDGPVDSDSPIEASGCSSEATLVSESNNDDKDCVMAGADANINADADVDVDLHTDTTADDGIEDLFSGEPDELDKSDETEPIEPINSSTKPSPVATPKASPEPQPRQPSAQPGPPPAPRQPIITETSIEQMRLWSTRSLANRHAKEIFMHWLKDRLPGWNNVDYLKERDESIEEELRAMGDRSSWKREEECFDTDKDKAKVVDCLSIEVVKKKCYGPNN